MSHEAYARTQRAAGGARDAEYRAFAASTRGLMEAGEGARAIPDAIHVNRSLWDALAADCANDDNALPDETRARIIALSRWVAAHSRRVLRNEDTVDALIDVNRIIMDGLAGKTAGSADPA